MIEDIEEKDKNVKKEKNIFLSGFKLLGKILCAMFIILILLVPFLMIIFKNDTADSAFKDHKKEWEEITKDFEIET